MNQDESRAESHNFPQFAAGLCKWQRITLFWRTWRKPFKKQQEVREAEKPGRDKGREAS